MQVFILQAMKTAFSPHPWLGAPGCCDSILWLGLVASESFEGQSWLWKGCPGPLQNISLPSHECQLTAWGKPLDIGMGANRGLREGHHGGSGLQVQGRQTEWPPEKHSLEHLF